jgi:hypothetical protein
MAHPQQSPSTTHELTRLLVGWLIVIVFVQGFAAVHAKVLGRLHSHLGATVDSGQADSAAPLFSHRRSAAELHHHDGLLRHHHHHVGDASYLPVAAEASTERPFGESPASAVLVAAFSVMLPAAPVWRSEDRRHVWSPAQRWTASMRYVAPPGHPPRR